MNLLKAFSFHFFNIVLIVWLEAFFGTRFICLLLSPIYVFYVTVSRGIYQALIVAISLNVLISMLCLYNNIFLCLGTFFVAYFWRDTGDCQHFFPQIVPIGLTLLVCMILQFGLNNTWFNVKVILPSLVISSLLSPLCLYFWDFISDSASLPRFSVLDNYSDEF